MDLDGLMRPIGFRLIEYGLVECIVTSEVGIPTAEAKVQVSSYFSKVERQPKTVVYLTDLKLASCSMISWLPRSLRKKVVALGVLMFDLPAPWNRYVLMSTSPLRAVPRAVMVVFRSISFPSCGRNPCFAREFNIGQGPRTIPSQYSMFQFNFDYQSYHLRVLGDSMNINDSINPLNWQYRWSCPRGRLAKASW